MFSLEEAKTIARNAAADAVNYYRRQGYVFGEIGLAFQDENIMTFAIPIPELQKQGYAPGALMISVNQLDGKIVKEIPIPVDGDRKTENN